MDNSDWIDTRQAAKLTGYSQDYVRNLARSGKIDVWKVGNHTLISKSSLLKYKADVK